MNEQKNSIGAKIGISAIVSVALGLVALVVWVIVKIIRGIIQAVQDFHAFMSSPTGEWIASIVGILCLVTTLVIIILQVEKEKENKRKKKIEADAAAARKVAEEEISRWREIEVKRQAERAAARRAVEQAKIVVAAGGKACLKCGAINPPRCHCGACLSGRKHPNGGRCSDNYSGECTYCSD